MCWLSAVVVLVPGEEDRRCCRPGTRAWRAAWGPTGRARCRRCGSAGWRRLPVGQECMSLQLLGVMNVNLAERSGGSASGTSCCAHWAAQARVVDGRVVAHRVEPGVGLRAVGGHGLRQRAPAGPELGEDARHAQRMGAGAAVVLDALEAARGHRDVVGQAGMRLGEEVGRQPAARRERVDVGRVAEPMMSAYFLFSKTHPDHVLVAGRGLVRRRDAHGGGDGASADAGLLAGRAPVRRAPVGGRRWAAGRRRGGARPGRARAAPSSPGCRRRSRAGRAR